MEKTLSVFNETNGTLPRVPFQRLKEKILGKKYILSIVIVGDLQSQRLNRAYRGKNKPTNILSFSLSKNEGELYLNLKQVRRETKLFKRPFANLVSFMLIHGMFHLKGHVHGSTMETKERAVRAAFNL